MKILISYSLSRILKRSMVWSGPFSLSFETAAICNLQCPECIAGQSQTKRASSLIASSLLKNKLLLHKQQAFYCNLYFQGEPFLHPGIFEMTTMASKMNYYTVISTNGHFLTRENCEHIVKSGLSKLIISLDGIDEASYLQYRKKGHFKKVVNGISTMAAVRRALKKSTPFIEVQFLVNKSNEHQLGEAGKFAKNLGVDRIRYKSMQIYTSEGMESLQTSLDGFNRYGKNGKSKRQSNGCFRLWSHMVYTSDGMLVPCCYDKVPDYGILAEMGSANDNMWTSSAMQAFRHSVLSGKEKPSICSNCAG